MKVNSKKGFTIVELVVALAIITIVSATAIGIINVQNTVYLRTVQTVEATNIAENAIECFRWANGDTDKFEETFKKSLDKAEDLKNVTDADGNKISGNYIVEKNNMIVEITITVTENKIDIYAHDGNKDILTKSYSR